ncbi:MAG TPA: Stp1/IreP family PP2C-type Ser/Thr phosphatase [Burkholderiaceae bacterium]|nr:Stp1/IreP family PP2C-type Ser/Thr phosphatase [Burkholderiaceae bacterium]
MASVNDLALRFALKSHPGKIRPLNEDALGADPNIGLFVLADGLGGYNAGEVASTMAVSSLLSGLGAQLQLAHSSEDSSFDPAGALRDSLVAMNEQIFRAALQSAVYEGMATTAVIAWFLGGRLWVAHAGDSRLYRYRSGALQQVTRDHSFSQELLDAGMISEQEARVLPAKNLVTRAVGASPTLEPEVHDYDVEAGDIILLCSDGLTEMVSNETIGAVVGADVHDIAQAARRLVDDANEAGGRDNCSVILVRVDDGLVDLSAQQSGPSDISIEDGLSEEPAAMEPARPAPQVEDGSPVPVG